MRDRYVVAVPSVGIQPRVELPRCVERLQRIRPDVPRDVDPSVPLRDEPVLAVEHQHLPVQNTDIDLRVLEPSPLFHQAFQTLGIRWPL